MTQIFVADRDGANVHQLTASTFNEQSPQWSPDGKKITFQRVEVQTPNPLFHIYEMALDGSGVTRIGSGAGSEYEASWSPQF